MKMKTKAFAVYDSKVKNYTKPLYHRNAAEAIRGFEQECNNPESQLNKFASDFTLFEIGEYDDETSILTPLPSPLSLGNALQFINVQNIKNVSQLNQ